MSSASRGARRYDGTSGKEAQGSSSIVCSIARGGRRLVGVANTSANYCKRGAISRGTELVRLSGLTGRTRQSEPQ